MYVLISNLQQNILVHRFYLRLSQTVFDKYEMEQIRLNQDFIKMTRRIQEG
jgi:hypothetical protein